MRRRTQKFLPLFIGVLAGFFLWGCGPRTATTLVQKESLFEVYLQHTLGKDHKPIDQGYEHPLELSPEEVSRLLESIRVKYPPGILQWLSPGQRKEIEPAFSDEEIQRMNEGISKALARAASVDRIAFRLKHPRTIFTPSITTGVVYVKDHRLVLILGNYHYIPTPATETGYDRFSNPLDVQDSQTVEIVPGPHQELHQADRRSLKNRWLMIDYKELLASAPEQPKETQEQTPDIEERLNTLKRLRDQGLITEEDYQEKKREILKQF